MKEVMIISGAYGHRPEGSPFVRLVVRGETCIVNDNEADRLVGLGVAKILCTSAIEPAENVMEDPVEVEEEIEEEIDIMSLSFNQLKEVAAQMGIEDIGKLNSKQKLIDAITAAADEAPEIAAEGLVE